MTIIKCKQCKKDAILKSSLCLSLPNSINSFSDYTHYKVFEGGEFIRHESDYFCCAQCIHTFLKLKKEMK